MNKKMLVKTATIALLLIGALIFGTSMLVLHATHDNCAVPTDAPANRDGCP